MALVYRVFERKNTFPNAKTPRVAGATVKQLGVITTKELAEDIADRCTVHRADVKAVLDVLSLSVMKYIKLGMGVRLGELGSLTGKISYKCAPTKEEFNQDLIKRASIRFTPSVEMKNKLKEVGYVDIDTYIATENKKKTTDGEDTPNGGTGTEDPNPSHGGDDTGEGSLSK